MAMSRILKLIAISFVFNSNITVFSQTNINCRVTIKDGPIEGVTTDSLNPQKKVCSYLGIPFASAPVGTLRFQPPQPPLPWTATLQANRLPNMCPQTRPPGTQISEDCLYLNVYQPKDLSNSPKEGLPVMIYIHGGAFTGGSSHYRTSSRFQTRGDVILVVIQYRLGLLGFFSTGDSVIPGNNGLKDQAFAIRWVSENIHHFGGNPGKVTLFGSSAGGASAAYQYLSPLNKGLIHGVIAQSGVALAPWAIDRNPKAGARLMAQRLGCPDHTDQMVTCLKGLSWEKIVKEQSEFVKESYQFLSYGRASMTPVIEPKTVKGAFITEDPVVLMKSGNIPDIPMMLGATKHDGSFVVGIMYLYSLGPKGLYNNTEYMRQEMVPDILKFYGVQDPTVDNRLIASSVELTYLNGVNRGSWNESMPGLVDIASVFGFKSPAQQTADILSRRGRKVYLYSFEHHSMNSLWPTYFGKMTNSIPVDHGVAHGDPLQYIFQLSGAFSPQDQHVSDEMLDMWINFAKYGNPTPFQDNRFDQWKTYDSVSEPYLKLNSTPSVQYGYRNSWRPNGFLWN